MSNIFFTADLHLGHKNIIEYCNRPFENIEEMNNQIIFNWNKTISNNDEVYVLGDFCLTNNKIQAQYWFDSLKGKKHLILGNHDKMSREIKGWESISYYKELEIDDKEIILSHYAFRVWNKSHYGSYHLYGHSHGTLLGIGKSMDVGADCNNYFPFSFEEVNTKLETRDTHWL
jgi:calcineurin-like phosphoesterase family protein